jgi:hypothetical protein
MSAKSEEPLHQPKLIEAWLISRFADAGFTGVLRLRPASFSPRAAFPG